MAEKALCPQERWPLMFLYDDDDGYDVVVSGSLKASSGTTVGLVTAISRQAKCHNADGGLSEKRED